MRAVRLPLLACLVVILIAIGVVVEPAEARAATKPHIFQHPAMSKDLIAFGYAGDLWTVPRAGGVATRLTTGVGIETDPIFSPDGRTIAFTGAYDGNTDVFTIPADGRRAVSRDVSSVGGFCGCVDAGWEGSRVPVDADFAEPLHAALRGSGDRAGLPSRCRCRWRTRGSSRRTGRRLRIRRCRRRMVSIT